MELQRPTEKLREAESQELRNQAVQMGTDVDLYLLATPRERNLIKARAHKLLKKRARELGLDPEEFVEATPERRTEMEQQVLQESQDDAANEDSEGGEDDPAVFTESMSVPPNDMNPRRREGISVGNIVELEKPPDLVGDTQPLNLVDLYSRWPIGRPGGEEYYIRVERIHPKSFNGVACAGFLAEVRRPMTEEQFGRWFGGREYLLTLYGPDARGRRDSDGNLIIKRLTQPIHVVVPIIPPNMNVLPQSRRSNQGEKAVTMAQEQNPYATLFPNAPRNSADAAIHGADLKFASEVMRMQQAELQAAKRNNEGSQGSLLSFASNLTKTQLDALQKDAERREQILREQLQAEREQRQREQEEFKSFKKEVDEAMGRRSGDSIEMLRFGDAANQRQAEYYRQQLEHAQRAHEEQLRVLREAHDSEMKRERERLRDLEDHFKRTAEEDRRVASEREKTLKDEIDRVRREERENADRRVAEVEKTAQQRYQDQEKAHERELRTQKENLDTRYTAEKNRMEFELASVKDRMEETKLEMRRVREESEKNSDPVQIIEKRKAEMKALGFVERDPEAPQSVWERFAQAAGGGVGQLLGNADVGQILGAISAITSGKVAAPPPGARGPMPPQLPPGAQPGPGPQVQQQGAPQPRRRRSEAWASQGSPVAVPPKQSTAPPMGLQPEPQQPQPQPQPEGSPPAPQQPQPVPAPKTMPPSKFHEVFSDQEIFEFLNTMEGAINAGYPPEEFAKAFVQRYPEQAKVAGEKFNPEDITQYMKMIVKEVPAAGGSPLLRRDGEKWLSRMWPEISQVAPPPPGQQADTPVAT